MGGLRVQGDELCRLGDFELKLLLVGGVYSSRANEMHLYLTSTSLE